MALGIRFLFTGNLLTMTFKIAGMNKLICIPNCTFTCFTAKQIRVMETEIMFSASRKENSIQKNQVY